MSDKPDKKKKKKSGGKKAKAAGKKPRKSAAKAVKKPVSKTRKDASTKKEATAKPAGKTSSKKPAKGAGKKVVKRKAKQTSVSPELLEERRTEAIDIDLPAKQETAEKDRAEKHKSSKILQELSRKIRTTNEFLAVAEAKRAKTDAGLKEEKEEERKEEEKKGKGKAKQRARRDEDSIYEHVSGGFFGELAIGLELATPEQIEECTREQTKKMLDGQNIRLGEICVELGVLTDEQVDKILQFQRNSLVTCDKCGARQVLDKATAGNKWQCKECDAIIEIPSAVITQFETQMTAIHRAEKTLKEHEKKDRKKEAADRSIGDYVILERIAQGGMGVIYKARQKKLDRIVALKVLIAAEDAPDEMLDRFRLEAKVVAQLKHPNIVPIYDTGILEGRHFLAMDFIHGESLRFVVATKKIPVMQTLEWVRKVAEALHYAHQHAIVHRDIKPENILIDENDEPQLTDFGLAMDIKLDSNLTRAGTIMGTPAYMSPEQVRGKKKLVDRRSDVYSLGAVMYEMLTGKQVLEFSNEAGLADLMKIATTDPVPPIKRNKHIPGDVETICLKALEKYPERRYQTAGEFAEDIESFIEGEPIKARPANFSYKAWMKIKKYKALSIAAVAAVLFLLIITVYFIIAGAQRRNQIESYLSQARQSLDSRDYDKAKELFSKVLALQDSNAQAELGIQQAKERAEIEQEYKQKRQAEQVTGEARNQLLIASGLLENPKKRPEAKKLLYDTIHMFDKALILDTESVSARKGKYGCTVTLGRVSMEDKEFGVATLMFSLANNLGVNNKEAENLLAMAQAARLQTEKLEKLLTDAQQKAAEGDWDAALRFYELAMQSEALTEELTEEITAKVLEAKYAKLLAAADSKLGNKDYAGSLEALVKARDFKKTVEVEEKLSRVQYLFNMDKGHADRNASRLGEAIAHYEKARHYAENPEVVEGLIGECREKGYRSNFDKALIHAQNKQWQSAVDYLGKALVFKKNDLEASRLKKEFTFVLSCPSGMAYIFSGAFPVGSDEPDDHNPKRTADAGFFFIDKYEVTNAQFKKFVDAGGYADNMWWDSKGFKFADRFVDKSGKQGPAGWEKGTFPSGKDGYPVVGISWYEASAYAKWAGKRLPTREEWEIAASYNTRTRSKSIYPWGDTWDMEAGNFTSKEPAQVGVFSKDRSPIGCYDMGGNVLEWTASPFLEDYHVIQGGTFGLSEGSMKRYARVSKQKSLGMSFRQMNVGFRCAMTPKLPSGPGEE